MADPTPAAQAPATPATPPAPAVPTPGGPKPVIAFDDFAKIDLRVAKIVHAENHPKADKLFKLQLDDGSGTSRQICAGIREAYKAEDLVGRLIVIVANLAPRMLRGEESRGMLLAASDAPKEAAAADPTVQRRVILLRPDADIAPGSIVS
ncbi:MAG TPA: methionine--tRNA ligase subunit beta [Phycisphaerales bacterium]|nr:methionine--tRNA ligase subunit beta [Phycisphaerales bacterium]